MRKFKWHVPNTSVQMICESQTAGAAARKFFEVYHGHPPKNDWDKYVLLKNILEGVVEYEGDH